ncbi:hypothetical protein FB451DRAFT_1226963 [Mycena latifolia]|nr:hypothetical protein FB451DRAFT_1226963 [Mycena latifolia]
MPHLAWLGLVVPLRLPTAFSRLPLPILWTVKRDPREDSSRPTLHCFHDCCVLAGSHSICIISRWSRFTAVHPNVLFELCINWQVAENSQNVPRGHPRTGGAETYRLPLGLPPYYWRCRIITLETSELR